MNLYLEKPVRTQCRPKVLGQSRTPTVPANVPAHRTPDESFSRIPRSASASSQRQPPAAAITPFITNRMPAEHFRILIVLHGINDILILPVPVLMYDPGPRYRCLFQETNHTAGTRPPPTSSNNRSGPIQLTRLEPGHGETGRCDGHSADCR